jgi:arginine decarboxylase-like protein
MNYYLSLISELRDKGLQITPIIEDKVELAALNNFKGEVGIRLDPDVKINAHWDKKFGRFGLSAKEILELGRIRNLKILHYHMSTQIEYQDGMIAPLKKAVDLYVKLHSHEGKPLFSTEPLGEL